VLIGDGDASLVVAVVEVGPLVPLVSVDDEVEVVVVPLVSVDEVVVPLVSVDEVEVVVVPLVSVDDEVEVKVVSLVAVDVEVAGVVVVPISVVSIMYFL